MCALAFGAHDVDTIASNVPAVPLAIRDSLIADGHAVSALPPMAPSGGLPPPP